MPSSCTSSENVLSVQQDSTINNHSQFSHQTFKAFFEKFCKSIPWVIYDSPEITNAVKSEKYTLFIYPPGLQCRETYSAKKTNMKPSHFPESLLCQAIALEHTLKDKIDIKYTTNTYLSPTNSLPLLLTPDGKPLVDVQMMSFLAPNFEKREDNELKLDLDSRALIHLVESALGDALLYYYFFDSKYYESMTKPIIGAGLSQPLQFLTGYNACEKVKKVLLSRYPIVKPDDILAAAREALKILELQLIKASKKESECAQSELKEKCYFFDNKSPTTLDYTVFAYVYLITTAFKKDKNHPLHQLALEFPKLRAYAHNFYKRVFGNDANHK